ncbi:MAG: hypothetical protein OEW00_06010 [candidate division Zixibacteria bacterium]|nr:hypothetical protein [candidate division Zixibacteria bacterium]
MKRTVILLAAGLLLLSSAVADERPAEKRQEIREVRQDKMEIRDIKATINELSHRIDLWHDANLKNDTRRIDRYEKDMFDFINQDILSMAARLRDSRTEVRQSQQELQRRRPDPVTKLDDRRDLRDDRWDLKEMTSMLKVKKRLFNSLRNSWSFSGKYRLLGDYVSVLKCELDRTRIEFAEDVEELRER